MRVSSEVPGQRRPSVTCNNLPAEKTDHQELTKKIIIKNVIVWVMSRHKSIFPEETSRSLHRGITCSLSLRNLIPLQEGMSEKCFPSLNPLPPHLTDLSGTKSTTDSFASGYGICGNGNQHQGHTSPQSTRLM